MDRHGMPETFEEYQTEIDTIKNFRTKMVMLKMLRDYKALNNIFKTAADDAHKHYSAAFERSITSQEHKPDDINLHNGMGSKGD